MSVQEPPVLHGKIGSLEHESPVRASILANVDKAFDRQVAFLSSLVRCKSLRGLERGVQEVVEAALRERGFDVRRVGIDRALIGKHPAFSPATIDYDETWNVVGVKEPEVAGGRSLALNAHVDVVPAGDAGRWSLDPFAGVRAGDWLYGRGAGDMKAGLSALIFAMDAIEAAELSLTAPVQIQSVVEEEVTGNGAAAMLHAGYVADAVLIPEPTDETLVRANSGVIKFRITLSGVPAHPREIGVGVSAIDAAFRLMSHLRRLEHRWNEEKGNHPGFPDVANPAALTIGTIAGGEWPASLPSSCSFAGRIGFYPGDDQHERVREFERFVAEAVEQDEVLRSCPAPVVEWVGVIQAGYALEPGTEAEASLARAHEAARSAGSSLESAIMACYLDSAIFAVHGDIPSLVYGPAAENIHAIDERVNLPSLLRVTKTIALFVAEWCGTRSMSIK